MRFLLFTLLIYFFGYSQSPIQPNHPSFKDDGLPQDVVGKIKPMSLEMGDYEMINFNPSQKSNIIETQSFHSEMMVQSENDVNYRLNRKLVFFFRYQEKTEYTYDDNGNLLLRENYEYINDSFVLNEKREYTNDEFDKRIMYLDFSWDTQNQEFNLFRKNEIYYDDNGNRTHKLGYNWNTENQSFVPYAKDEYRYDENGYRTLWLRYFWHTDSQSFIISEKTEYQYDDGKETVSDFSWDSENASFFTYPYDKDEYYFNQNGNVTLWIDYTNDGTINYKEEYFYDENNLLNIKTRYDWYSELGIYKPSFRMDISTISENETNLVREGITYEYDTNFNTWNELEGEEFKSYWYYTKESSLSTNPVESNSFSIYPNPTTSILTIEGNKEYQIKVYDLLGNKVLETQGNSINMEHLSTATYIVKATDKSNNQELTYKVVKN